MAASKTQFKIIADYEKILAESVAVYTLHKENPLANVPLNKENLFAADIRPMLDVPEESERVMKLDATLKDQFEYLFNTDFSDVRIHTGHSPHEAVASAGAEAFTAGSDIYFATAKYAPETEEGMKLLAHELQHVVQNQRGDRFVYNEDIAQAEHEADLAEDAMNISLMASGNAFPNANLTPSPMPSAVPTPYSNSSASQNIPLKKGNASSGGSLDNFSKRDKQQLYKYITDAGNVYYFTQTQWIKIKEQVIALWQEHLDEVKLYSSESDWAKYFKKFVEFVELHRI